MSPPRPKRLHRRTQLQRQAIKARDDRRLAALEARRAAKPTRGGSGRRSLPADVEAALQARAGGRCELCGTALRGRCQRHHRKLKSQGGLDQVANLVMLHPNCHNTIHLNPLWAKDNGWIVTARANPARVPIMLHEVRRVLLTQTGDYAAAAA